MTRVMTSAPNATVDARRGRRRDGIGLCLSGGGYRASLFHLGALRRLHELGILQKVRTISCVSGGAILGGFLADRMISLGRTGDDGMRFDDWDRDVAGPFHDFVRHDLRTVPFIAHILWNWMYPTPRARHLMRLIDRRLSSRRLAEVPAKPRFVFCATDMQFGVHWQFSRERMGDYRAGYIDDPDVSLALAVTASACFPPIFGPIPIRAAPSSFKQGDYGGPDRDRIRSSLSLTDGGVYDNMGLEPVLDGHEFVIASDCGAPFSLEVKKTPILRMLRYATVGMNQVGALRRRQLMAQIRDGYEEFRVEPDPDRSDCPNGASAPDCRLRGRTRVDRARGTYWRLWSDTPSYKRTERGTVIEPVGYSNEFAKGTIARIRTDLDRFTRVEREVLGNHGYLLAEAAIRKHLPGLIETDQPAEIPYPDSFGDEDALRHALRHSHSRLRFWSRWRD